MDRDKLPPIIGAALLVAGILIVFIVFTQAMAMVTNVGDYFREQFPEEEGGEEEAEGPTAAFSWNTDELDVNFQDESEEGDSPIRHWDWSFGDGSSSNQQNPSHTYNDQGDYRITLRVEDQNGETDTVNSNVYVDWGNYDNGFTEEGMGDMNFEFSAGGILTPIAAALLVGIMFIVMFLVGAAMIKAGWNLIKPGPSTLKLKIKPKKLEVENAQPEPTYAQQPAHSPKPTYSPPEPAYAPQPSPDAVIASMRALPQAQNQQQPNYNQADSGYHGQQSYASDGPPQPMPQTPSPPSPSFDSPPPSPEAQDNTPHPNQTSLGAYPSNPPPEEPEPTPPAPEATAPQSPTQKTEVKREVAPSNRSNNSRWGQQSQKSASQQPKRQNTQRSRQQQKRGAPRSQNKRGGSSKSKKGKGRKKR
jgi:PKD repeat protein